MILSNPPYPVPANAVHVWRGYRAASTTPAAFLAQLGETFIPSATIMQPPIGLRAYLPGAFSSDSLPAGVPEETALLFWDSQTAYTATAQTLSGRVYTNTHWRTYDMTSSSASWPVSLANPLVIETPYMVLENAADWMTGNACQLLVALASPPDLTSLATWAQGVASSPPAGLEGAYLVAGQSYVLWWELWSGEPSDALRTALAANGSVIANGPSAPAVINGPFEGTWAGVTISAGDMFNMQFNRPGTTS
ncbi:MAG TPA: hypothetical protein VGD79_01530 [Thermoanaerobaculia bacterium]